MELLLFERPVPLEATPLRDNTPPRRREEETAEDTTLFFKDRQGGERVKLKSKEVELATIAIRELSQRRFENRLHFRVSSSFVVCFV